jgi:hypothetical protein
MKWRGTWAVALSSTQVYMAWVSWLSLSHCSGRLHDIFDSLSFQVDGMRFHDSFLHLGRWHESHDSLSSDRWHEINDSLLHSDTWHKNSWPFLPHSDTWHDIHDSRLHSGRWHRIHDSPLVRGMKIHDFLLHSGRKHDSHDSLFFQIHGMRFVILSSTQVDAMGFMTLFPSDTWHENSWLSPPLRWWH